MKDRLNAMQTSNSKQMEDLKKIFPQCFDKQGAFIPHKLQEIVESSGTSLSQEGYSLNWLGKSYARLLANQDVRTLLKARTEHNEKPENKASQNILIKGDNLEVLKHLVGAYSEKIKMIYIDPPYNTGSDGFVYQDDRKFTTQQLMHLAGISEQEAKRILEFTNSQSNSHSAWLTFMYPRLYIARQLLREDGVIFISIDDNEQAQLKLVCDEVFGEQNFVANFLWKKKSTTSNVDGADVSSLVDYTLCYKRSNLKIAPRIKFATDRIYPKTDELGKYRTTVVEKRNEGDYERPTMQFKILGYLPREGKRWQMGEAKARELEQQNRFFYDGEKIQLKIYDFEDVDTTSAQPNLLENYGSSESAQKNVKILFNNVALFDTPKPVDLLLHLIQITTNNDSIILDFFAGSGTTAHAVMQLNAEDGGNRQFIMVQIDEPTDPKSEAFKTGYHTIFDITCERIKRAAAKIKSEFPDTNCDLGFKQFETIPVFENYLEQIEELTPNTELFNANTLTTEQLHDLMLTWQVMDGIPVTDSLIPLELGEYTAYQGKEKIYFIEEGITLDHIIILLEKLDNDPSFTARHWIAFGYILDSKAHREISEAIHHPNRKGTEIIWDVRF